MGREAHQRNPDESRLLFSNKPNGEMGSGTGQASTRGCTSRYCHECLIKTLMSSPRVYLRPPIPLNQAPAQHSVETHHCPMPQTPPNTRAPTPPSKIALSSPVQHEWADSSRLHNNPVHDQYLHGQPLQRTVLATFDIFRRPNGDV